MYEYQLGGVAVGYLQPFQPQMMLADYENSSGKSSLSSFIASLL